MAKKVKFGIPAICEIIITIILIPFVVKFATNGYYNFVYNINFQESLDAYVAGNETLTVRGLEKARDTRLSSEPDLFLGAIYIKKNQFEDARRCYRNAIKKDPYSSSAILGDIVCDIYSIPQGTSSVVQQKTLGTIEERLTELSKKFPNFPDVKVNLAQVYLLQAESAFETDNMKRANHYLDLALARFEEFLPKREDQGISNPPSYFGMYSIYTGMGLLNYRKFTILDKESKTKEDDSKTVSQLTNYLKESAKYFKSAAAIRTGNKEPLLNIDRVYSCLLGAPWFTNRDEINLVYKDYQDYYQGERSAYLNHRQTFEKIDPGTQVFGFKNEDLLYNYLAKGYGEYKSRNPGGADGNFNSALRVLPESIPILLSQCEAKYATLEDMLKQKVYFEYGDPYKVFMDHYETFLNKHSEALTPEELSIMYNNMGAIQCRPKATGRMEIHLKIKDYMAKALDIPAEKNYNVGAVEGPVNLHQILNHNLYYLYLKLAILYKQLQSDELKARDCENKAKRLKERVLHQR